VQVLRVRVLLGDDPVKSVPEQHDLVGEAWTFERRCRFCPFGPGIEKVIREHEARHEEFEDEEVLKEEEEEGDSDDDEIKEVNSDDEEIKEVYNDEDDEDGEDDDIEVLDRSSPVEVIEEDEDEEVFAEDEVEEVEDDDEVQEVHDEGTSEDLKILFDFDDDLFEDDYKPKLKKEEKMIIEKNNVEEDEGIEEICNVKGMKISERQPQMISRPPNFKAKEVVSQRLNHKANNSLSEVSQKSNHKANNFFREDSVQIEPTNKRRSKGKAQNQRNVKTETIVEPMETTTKDEDFISVIEEDNIGDKDEGLKLKRQVFDEHSRWGRVSEEKKKYLMRMTGETEEELKIWFTKRRQLQKFNSE